jgi:endo-1,4-beta-xylanase
LDILSTAGVEIAISDLGIAGAPAEDYVDVVQACLDTPACQSITVAGLKDGDSGGESDDALFDSTFWYKPAAIAILDALDE